MNDALITVAGNVAGEPRYLITRNGTPLLSLRLASTPRRFDRETGQFRDGDTMFMTVTCWRSLAANGQEALEKGDPVVVTGRLRLREYERDGERRFSAEIEATALGHDLSRGVSRFDRARRSAGATADDRRVAARLADVWETSEERPRDHEDPDRDGAAAGGEGDTVPRGETPDEGEPGTAVADADGDPEQARETTGGAGEDPAAGDPAPGTAAADGEVFGIRAVA